MLVLNDVTYDSRVRREAGALATGGYDVRVIGTHTATSPLADRESVQRWELVRFRYGKLTQMLRRHRVLAPFRRMVQAAMLIQFLRRQQAAIWHAHDFPALVLVALAWLGRGRPGGLVYDTHELYFHRTARPRLPWHRLSRWIGLHVERLLARRADLIVTTSPAVARFVADRWRVAPPVVILNGAVAPIGYPALQRPAGAGLWVVHTGALNAQGRRLPDLLDGVAAAADDVHLTFIGDGPQAGTLRRLAADLNLSERVHFIPPVPPEAVSAAIRDADAAVVAVTDAQLGYALALPNKLFEAIAAGLPVLGPSTPALADFWATYPVGLLWPPGDLASLAGAIAALRDQAARERWKQACHRAQRAVGWTAQASLLVARYRPLMARAAHIPPGWNSF